MKKKWMKNTAQMILAGVLAMNMITGIPVMAESPAPDTGVSGEQTDIYKNAEGKLQLGRNQDTDQPVTGTITVSGVTEEDADVKAYQIVDGYYNSDCKLVKYVLMDPVNGKIAGIGDETKGQTSGKNDIITHEEIAAIADNIEKGTFDADKSPLTLAKQEDGTYQTHAEPGMYLILVTSPKGENNTASTSEWVYNPAVAAINISDMDNGDIEPVNSSLDMAKFFKEDSNNIYVKSTNQGDGENKPDKKILDGNGLAVTTGEGHGSTAAIGDTIHFEISNAKVPSYSKDYTEPKFYLTDSLSVDENHVSFGPIQNLVIKMNGRVLPTKSKGEEYTNYEITTLGENSEKITNTENTEATNFKIAFTKDFLYAHSADSPRPSITVTYEAKLEGAVGENFSENVNHAEIHYTNSPDDPSEGKPEPSEHEESHNTYSYTFAINGAIDAQGGDTTAPGEIRKVHQDPTAKEENPNKSLPLPGAEFTIYKNEACSEALKERTVDSDNKVTLGESDYKAVSDDKGLFTFLGLKAGTYYVKETKAPQGYALSDAVYKFGITAEFNNDGTLKDYSIKISRKANTKGQTEWTEAGKATYSVDPSANQIDSKTGAVKVGKITKGSDGAENVIVDVVNTKLQSLPSTGGAGIRRFIVIAIAFGAALVIYTVATRKQKK